MRKTALQYPAFFCLWAPPQRPQLTRSIQNPTRFDHVLKTWAKSLLPNPRCDCHGALKRVLWRGARRSPHHRRRPLANQTFAAHVKRIEQPTTGAVWVWTECPGRPKSQAAREFLSRCGDDLSITLTCWPSRTGGQTSPAGLENRRCPSSSDQTTCPPTLIERSLTSHVHTLSGRAVWRQKQRVGSRATRPQPQGAAVGRGNLRR